MRTIPHPELAGEVELSARETGVLTLLTRVRCSAECTAWSDEPMRSSRFAYRRR